MGEDPPGDPYAAAFDDDFVDAAPTREPAAQERLGRLAAIARANDRLAAERPVFLHRPGRTSAAGRSRGPHRRPGRWLVAGSVAAVVAGAALLLHAAHHAPAHAAPDRPPTVQPR